MKRSILGLALSTVLMAAAEDQTTGGGAVVSEPSAPATDAAPATDGSAPAAPVKVAGLELTYFFKTPTLKDEEGKEIGKGKKPDDVKIVAPMPTVEDLINYLAAADGTREAKVKQLIIDQVQDAIYQAGRKQINEFRESNPDKQFTATDMDLSKLSLQVIAETPKGQRGGWAPSDEELKDFNEAYTNVLVHVIQYDPKKTKTHTDHWKSGLTKVKTNKPVIAKLQEFLTLFASRVDEPVMEENQQTYDWLVARADRYAKAEEKNYLEAL